MTVLIYTILFWVFMYLWLQGIVKILDFFSGKGFSMDKEFTEYAKEKRKKRK